MIQSIVDAWQAVGAQFLIFTLGLWLVTGVSLARLISIGALNMDDKTAARKQMPENIAHSVFKLAFNTILIAAMARLILAPDYPGGAFALDWPLFYSCILQLVFAIPGIGLIAVETRSFANPDAKPSIALLGSAAIFSIITAGFGQLMTAGVAINAPLGKIISSAPILWAPMLVVGGVLNLGIIAHLRCMRILTKAQTVPIKTVAQDAAIAAFPTMIAIFLAASSSLPTLAP